MNIYQELAGNIRNKYFGAVNTLINEGYNYSLIENNGCVIIAFDGLINGRVSQDDYKKHLQIHAEGMIFTLDSILKIVLSFCQRINEKHSLNLQPRFYSSSPLATGRNDLIPIKISRKEALEIARGLKEGLSLGVLIAGRKGEINHLFCLKGYKGGIFRVDSATKQLVSRLSIRDAANLIRRNQRHGNLVIDI